MIETRKQFAHDNEIGTYYWDRVYLIDDESKNVLSIYEPCTNRFWLGLYEDKNLKGKVFSRLKKYRDQIVTFLKEEMSKTEHLYLDWLKPEEQPNRTGNFWQDMILQLV